MTISVKVASAWATVQQMHVRDGGSWKAVQQGYVKEAGSWKQFHSAGGAPPPPPPAPPPPAPPPPAPAPPPVLPTPAISTRTYNSVFTESGRITFASDGTLQTYAQYSGAPADIISGEWLTSSPGTVSNGTSGAYDITFTYVSGPNPQTGGFISGRATKTGAAYGVALNLGTDRYIQLESTLGSDGTSPNGTLVFDAVISETGTGVVLDSARYTINVTGNL